MPFNNFKYVIFNKPFDVLPQFTDKQGRATLSDYIKVSDVYPVGRLDLDSEGLLFLTNDTIMNHQLSSPKFKQPKTYWAQVEGIPDKEALEKLKSGVIIQDKITLPAKATMIEEPANLWPRPKPIRFRKNKPTSWLRITLYEGRNRQLRKMTAAVGFPCLRIIRIGIGPLSLDDLKPGEYREINRPKIQFI